MIFAMKIHEKDTSNETIAVCDEDLLDTEIYDKERDIEFKISREFYGEEKFEWTDIKDILINGKNINLVGNEIVKMAVESGIVNPSNTIDINGVKHAQVYFI